MSRTVLYSWLTSIGLSSRLFSTPRARVEKLDRIMMNCTERVYIVQNIQHLELRSCHIPRKQAENVREAICQPIRDKGLNSVSSTVEIP